MGKRSTIFTVNLSIVVIRKVIKDSCVSFLSLSPSSTQYVKANKQMLIHFKWIYSFHYAFLSIGYDSQTKLSKHLQRRAVVNINGIHPYLYV